jgi:hypothetical protein
MDLIIEGKEKREPIPKTRIKLARILACTRKYETYKFDLEVFLHEGIGSKCFHFKRPIWLFFHRSCVT